MSNWSKEQIHQLRVENMRYGSDFVPIPPAEWRATPGDPMKQYRNRVFRNRLYLVQEFVEADGMIRISINRTDVDRDGEWKDGISWDELQRIKNVIGFDRHAAIEVYPPADKTVNVANMRHLWIVPNNVKSTIPIWGVNRES